jgi:salicylate hydroxylase
MGDAAHAMTPWQGSGAGQAIEDAMILETLLEEVREPRQLDAAFKAYDAVRRPRTQKIVASSKITGHIICGRGPGIGLDIDKLREALASRWNFIYGLDMKEHKKAALAAMN